MADEFTKRIYNKLPSTRYSLLYEYYTYLQWSVEKGANATVSVNNYRRMFYCTKTEYSIIVLQFSYPEARLSFVLYVLFV